jgi:hypothetical protein
MKGNKWHYQAIPFHNPVHKKSVPLLHVQIGMLALSQPHHHSIRLEARGPVEKLLKALVWGQATMPFEEDSEAIFVTTFVDSYDTVVNPRLARSITNVSLRNGISVTSNSTLLCWNADLTGLGVHHTRVQAGWVQTTRKMEFLCLNKEISTCNQHDGMDVPMGLERYITGY